MASSLFAHFRNVSDADKSKAIEKLVKDSTPDYDFFFMVALSVLMATVGLWIDSSAVVIGSMLIAPILYPILSLSLGISMNDLKLMSRSLYAIFTSMTLGILAAAAVTLAFASNYTIYTAEILDRTEPSLLYFIVAIVSGIAVSFALVRPELSETLVGIAVSVALIPPLAVVGIGVAKLDWFIISGSAILFLVNIVGIIFASMVSFSLLNLYSKRYVAETAIQRENQRIEIEHERVKYMQEKGDGMQ
jgi:uncharacterized hydrophobic protein (TIGR00271 family)